MELKRKMVNRDYKFIMINPSLYSKAGNLNYVDNLVEDFDEYDKFRAEGFKLRCKHDNIPSLAFIHNFEAIEEKHLDIPRMHNEAIMAEVETFTFPAEITQLMSNIYYQYILFEQRDFY